MGQLRGTLKFRNSDASLDLNRRLFGVVSKGVYEGDVQHPPPVPLAGTVSISNGGTTATGVGTAFTTQLVAGSVVKFGSDTVTYVVTGTPTPTSFSITIPYAGTSQTNVISYVVFPAGTFVHRVIPKEPLALQVDVLPFVAMSVDGMLVSHEGAPTTLNVLLATVQYVVCRAKYVDGGDPILSLEVLTSTAYDADPDRNQLFLGQPVDHLIVLAKITGTTGPASTVQASDLDFTENHIVNSIGRFFIRGVVDSLAVLNSDPLDDPNIVVTGDLYLALAEQQFYQWDGAAWQPVGDQAIIALAQQHLAVSGPGAGGFSGRDGFGYPSHPANAISFDKTGTTADITGTNPNVTVQTALFDVDAKKVRKVGDSMSGVLTITGTSAALIVTPTSGNVTAITATGKGTGFGLSVTGGNPSSGFGADGIVASGGSGQSAGGQGGGIGVFGTGGLPGNLGTSQGDGGIGVKGLGKGSGGTGKHAGEGIYGQGGNAGGSAGAGIGVYGWGGSGFTSGVGVVGIGQQFAPATAPQVDSSIKGYGVVGYAGITGAAGVAGRGNGTGVGGLFTGAGASVSLAALANGAGVFARASSTDGPGVYAEGSSAGTNNPGVYAVGLGGNSGVYSTGGTTGGAGVYSLGSGSSGPGVVALGANATVPTLSNHGIIAIGGDNDAIGVYAEGGLSDGTGVYGLASGGGVGVAGRSTSESSYGIFGFGYDSSGTTVTGSDAIHAQGGGAVGSVDATAGAGLVSVGGAATGAGTKTGGIGIIGTGGAPDGTGVKGIGGGTLDAIGVHGIGGASDGVGVKGEAAGSGGAGVLGVGVVSGSIGVVGMGVGAGVGGQFSNGLEIVTGKFTWTQGGRAFLKTTASQGPLSAGVFTAITWGTIQNNAGGVTSTPGTTITLGNTGFYVVSYSVSFIDTTAASANLFTDVLLDAVSIVGSTKQVGWTFVGSKIATLSHTLIVSATAAQTITVRAKSSVATTSVYGVTGDTTVTVFRLPH